MPNTLVERLARGETLIADGATGTNLQAAGLEPGVAPEEWLIDAPEKILALHRSFLQAGSDIILTDTFGGTRLRLRDSKYADRAPELNRRAAGLAREAAADRPEVLVAGSLGPTGLLMEPFGELTADQAMNAFAEQANALAEGGVDFLLFETFFSIEEAVYAIQAARQVCALPIVCSFSYDQGTRTMMGHRPSQVVDAIAPLGVAALGANCGKSLEDMEKVIAEIADKHTGLPIWCKPNAGLPTGIPPKYNVTPEGMGEFALRFLHLGARVLGGCCGSSPAHVAAIAAAVRNERQAQARL